MVQLEHIGVLQAPVARDKLLRELTVGVEVAISGQLTGMLLLCLRVELGAESRRMRFLNQVNILKVNLK